jgi:hypothetical protein
MPLYYNKDITVQALGLMASNPRRHYLNKVLSGFLGKGVDILKFRTFRCMHLVEDP